MRIYGVEQGTLLNILRLPPTHQQHPHSHHGCRARGHCAVHQDHVVVTDVLGEPQVVELQDAPGSGGPRRPHQGSRGLHRHPLLWLHSYPALPEVPLPHSQGPLTSGSPVSWLVWMRMVPMRTSLHTARSAGSMVSPARRMDTPVIWGVHHLKEIWILPLGNTDEETL